MVEGYTELNTFSRRPCPTQLLSYLVILLQNISFWVFIQPHYLSQATRFIMIVFFSISLMVLFIIVFMTSYLDPSDPMIR